MAPLLERLLALERVRLSKVTLYCVKVLRYTPGTHFREKAPENDFSELLQPLQYFVDMFSKSLEQVKTTCEVGENESALRHLLSERLAEIQAPAELEAFFTNWNIKVVGPDGSSPSTPDHGLDTAPTSEYRKGVLQELDIINCAIEHRLLRWASTFLKRSINDMFWPTSFSPAERKTIRTYMSEYAQNHDLLAPAMSDEALKKAVADIQDDDDLPVMARTPSVLRAALLATRDRHATRIRKQSQAAKEVVTEDDSDEDGDVVVPGRKRKNRFSVSNKNNAPGKDAYADHQGQSTKRARKRSSLAKTIARHMEAIKETEEEE